MFMVERRTVIRTLKKAAVPLGLAAITVGTIGMERQKTHADEPTSTPSYSQESSSSSLKQNLLIGFVVGVPVLASGVLFILMEIAREKYEDLGIDMLKKRLSTNPRKDDDLKPL